MAERRRLGDRAIIAGGSLAGLLTARVLADHFDEVLVLDRDAFPERPAERAMTPQSHHVHILLKGGEVAIEALLPGFTREMAELGSVPMQAGQDLIFGNDMGFQPRWESGVWLLSQSRALLEHSIRTRVRNYADHIRIQPQTTVRGLSYDAQDHRITGVETEASDGQRDVLAADLVVDASGRGAGGMRWLGALGLSLPEVDEVRVDFGYASAVFKLAEDRERDWKGVGLGSLPPKCHGGLMLPIEGGAVICSLAGRADVLPPDDLDGFIGYASKLPHPHMHDAISAGEPLSDIATMGYQSNRFRHYERMNDLPSGFLPVGDALCSVNPAFGQGMSSTAKQVKALSDTLASADDTGSNGPASLAQAVLRKAADVAEAPWRQANFVDLMYDTTEGDRSMFSDEETETRIKLQMLSMSDPDVRMRMFKVAHLLEPLSTLFDDEMMAKVAAL